MNRLFLSLYSVLLVGILAINVLSEWVWQAWNEDSTFEVSIEQTQLSSLIAGLANVEKVEIERLDRTTDISIKPLRFNEVAWPKAQLTALQDGNVVTTFDAQDSLHAYVLADSGDFVYAVGPFKNTSSAGPSLSHWLLLLSSHLLLAGVIYVWSRPLWHDLRHLDDMASHVGKGQFGAVVKGSKRSPIRNIVDRFNQMTVQLAQLLSDQKTLINAVSHELRTPLSRLKFSLAMLSPTEEQNKLAMQQDVNEIAVLVDEMLSYARLEHVHNLHTAEHIEVTALLRNVVEKIRQTDDKIVITDLPHHFSMWCFPSLLEKAIQNLILNGLRHANSYVSVSMHVIDNRVHISVEDDGCGIPVSDRERVFEPFFRVDQNRSTSGGGFGLGLAIVQRVCQWHNGECVLLESPTGGCCFRVSLPLTGLEVRGH